MCTIRVATTKALISFAVTAKFADQSECVFVFSHMQTVGLLIRRLNYFWISSLKSIGVY